MITDIIDVDHTACSVDAIRAAHARGLRAIIAKCTEGRDFTDPSYVAWLDRIAEVNASLPSTEQLLVGGYHFGTNSSAGRQQADWFLAHLHRAGLDMLPVLDWEWNPHKTIVVNGREIPGDMSLANAEAFVERVHEVEGRWPLVYTSRSFLVHDLIPEHDSVLGHCPLWVCWYSDGAPHLPVSPWRKADLWQYTNGAAGPHDARTFTRITQGLGRKVDRSAWMGDEASLRAWWAQAGRAP